MIRLTLLRLAVGCAPEEPVDPGEPPAELEIPELAGVDLAATYEQALDAALAIDVRAPWDAHLQSLGWARPGCPDLWVGLPSFVDERDPAGAGGLSWGDHCLTQDQRRFSGWSHWTDAAHAEGDASTPEGLSLSGERALRADAGVSEGEAVALTWRGEASDALSRVEGPGYTAWTYASLVQGALGGEALALGRGYRADLYQRYTGGDTRTLELRGNVYWFEHRLAGRFDSVRADLAWAAPESIGEGCAAEPQGYISVRDTDGYWFDLVFSPVGGLEPGVDYPNAPYTACDGCGTLFVRGLEQPEPVCPDFSGLWAEGRLAPPPIEDFVLSTRAVLGGLP